MNADFDRVHRLTEQLTALCGDRDLVTRVCVAYYDDTHSLLYLLEALVASYNAEISPELRRASDKYWRSMIHRVYPPIGQVS